jgi:hypothetical protein
MTVLCSILVLSSCAWNRQSSAPQSPVAQQQEDSTETSPSEPPSSAPSSSGPSAVSAPRPLFYDFPDIPVPSEVKLLSKDSYVFQAGSLKTGLLTFRGRVDINSAINFFQMAMPREGWKAKGGFRYKRSVLIFEKPEKTCVINLYEKLFYTYVEIYVAPMAGQI